VPAIADPPIAPSARRATLSAAGILALVLAGSPTGATEFAAFADAGQAPAPVDTVDLDGRPFSIGGDPSRPTLVHFFASWCEPCEDELPALMRYAEAEGDRVRLIGVAVGEPASRARSFVARFGFPGPIARDPEQAVARAFGVRGLPATAVLTPSGGRLLRAAGPVDWASPGASETLHALSIQLQEHKGESR
jgi:thiol-disulfide isomerase/thioredoxin